MKNTLSYRIILPNEFKILNETISYYRRCVNYLIDIVLIEYDESLSPMKDKNRIEKMIHSTRANQAKYEIFDQLFYKMPCYLRRSALTEAYGIVQAYKSQMTNWEANNKEGKKPFLKRNQAFMPAFYKGNMFEMVSRNICRMKIYKNNDWVWHNFRMRNSDIKYIEKYFSMEEASAPVIEKANKRYALRLTFQKETKMPEKVSRVCAVDMGLNHDAVCSIIDEDGTVIARRFIDNAREKDHMNHILNNIKKAQSHGNRKTPRLWRFYNNYTKALCNQTVHDIVMFALEYQAQCIVCEYLDMKGKIHGNKKQRLALWRHRDIQHKLECRAHREGLRFAHVNARNTSKLAYDGSGQVIRNKKNHSLCTFQTGKEYNCDLSASYNIGARYFIRERLKTLSEKKRSDIQAKVPECSVRTSCTLSTLISLDAVL